MKLVDTHPRLGLVGSALPAGAKPRAVGLLGVERKEEENDLQHKVTY